MMITIKVTQVTASIMSHAILFHFAHTVSRAKPLHHQSKRRTFKCPSFTTGSTGKPLLRYSVLHGDKFSHLCLDENTSVYVSRGAYPNACFTSCLCQVTSITYVAFSLWNSVHMICLRLSSFKGNISTLFSIAARLSAL